MEKKFNKICSQLRSSELSTNGIDEVYFKGESIQYKVDIKTELNKLTDDIIEVSIILMLIGHNVNDKEKEYLNVKVKASGHYQVSGYSKEEIETVAFAFGANDVYPMARLYISNQCHFLNVQPPNLSPLNFAEIIKEKAE